MFLLRLDKTIHPGSKILRGFQANFTTAPKADLQRTEAIRDLRRKTGVSFAHIKKALEKHEWNVNEAEKWLQEETKRLGWERSNAVSARRPASGLLGVVQNNNGIFVAEVNCETDFVAKNSRFHNILSTICHGVANSNKSASLTPLSAGHPWIKLNREEVSSLRLPSSACTIEDFLKTEIGQIGENIKLGENLLFWPRPVAPRFAGYFNHPLPILPAVVTTELGPLQVAKFVGIVEVLDLQNVDAASSLKLPVEEACRQLSQHVIGLNPQTILPDKKAKAKEEVKPVPSDAAAQTTEPSEVSGDKKPQEDDESALVKQSFVLDSEVTVEQWLAEQGLKVLDFVRLELGSPFGSNN